MWYAFVGQIDPHEDENAAKTGHPCHALMQHDATGNHRTDGIQIDVVAGSQGTYLLTDKAPECKAREAGDESEEEQVAGYHRLQQLVKRVMPGLEQKDRQYGQQSVEEYFAGYEHTAVMA